MPEELFVVTGAGPVGWTVAEQLAGQGHRVRVLTRSGSGPEHHLIEKRAVDVSDRTLVAESLADASAVFHCIHGSAYSVKAWEGELPRAEAAVLAAAGEAGAVVVFPESLYSYSEPDRVMTEDSPRAARGGKRGVRSALLQAREASATNTVSVVAGDFFGPRVRTSHAGERMVPRILARRPLQVVGSADQPHSFTFVPDLAAAMIKAAQTPALWNRVLHAPTNPALTQQQLAGALAEAAGVPRPKVGVLPGWLLRAVGVFSADVREIAEMLYQFQRPFVMDSAASEAALDLGPTPPTAAARMTVEWWRQEAPAAAARS
ncbi:NAD-dependent epimerase/dehydratase family protein [Arthrobacter sp. ISL-5]|uniref:NAD-dependent epimerase/dehydratase family protein n=1 Tax=Arthrobacter sp. ISL-5 TaxID=2819111 RepID=UPI001BE7D228|nr:NAD-dependent epimerase/dehydratase family protein [Arthrobacter sp. ISL-5]MBT2553059.1 NAD-dependent epimerase/dehydratase family protein [Arthrobacter sp. ISL-5]